MTDSITTITPPARRDTDFATVRAAFERAAAVAPLAGDDTVVSGRVSLYVKTPQAVNAIAAAWGVTPRWGTGGTHYVAERILDGSATEAVFYGQRPAAAVNEAAAA